MKKVLLATTILAASAGFAAADVTVSGTARMGVAYDGSKADNELSFTNRVRIIFTASGETDGGLSFGASVRADNAAAGNAGTAGTVFISGAFGTITMGDVDDAFGALFGDIAGVGLTGLGDFNELNSSADGGGFGRLPAATTVGGLGVGTYNSLFTFGTQQATGTVGGPNPTDQDAVAAGVQTYLTTEAKLVGAGADIALVWGPLFDRAAYNTAVDNAIDVIDADRDQATYAESRITYEDALSAVLFGFKAEIMEAAIAAKIAATDGTGFDPMRRLNGFAPGSTLAQDFDVDRAVALVDLPGKAELLELFSGEGYGYYGMGGGEDFLSFDISTAGIKPIEARVLYTYALDGFGFAMGYSQTGANEAYSFAGSYEVNGLKLSAGMAKAKWDDAIVASITGFGDIEQGDYDDRFNADGSAKTASFVISNTHDLEATDLNLGVSYTMDAVTVAAVYQDKKFELNGVQVDRHKTTGLSVEYTMDALTLTAFGSQTDADAYAQKARAYGIGAAYDLGGGASVVGGIVDRRGFTGSSNTTADLGVSFTF